MTESEGSKPTRPRRRWLRRVLIALLLVIVAGIVVGVYGYRSASRIPVWYVPADPVATSQQARGAEDKIADVQTWAASKQAYASASTRGTPIATRPADELVVSFTQDEVNSFLSKWYSAYGSQVVGGHRLSDVLRAPMVRIANDRVTVAGIAPALGGRIVSMDLRVELVDGTLRFDVTKARSGDLPVPEFTWAKPRQTLIDALTAMAMKFAPTARFDNTGAANPATISAVMAMQGVDGLTHRDTINVLFLPVPSGKDWSGLPVRLKRCELADGSITLVTEPLEDAGRDAVLHRLRGGTEPEKTPIYLTPTTRNTP